MLLHIPFTISDGFKVGSSTTSTISAPLGSSSSWLGAGRGGGGGGDVSAGTEVTLFKTLLEAFAKVVLLEGVEVLTGTECLTPNFVFSKSSSELRVDGEDDRPLSWDSFFFDGLFLSIFSYFCGFGRNSLGFLVLALGVSLTTTLQPELEELADADRLWEPESRDLERTLLLTARSLFLDSSRTR